MFSEYLFCAKCFFLDTVSKRRILALKRLYCRFISRWFLSVVPGAAASISSGDLLELQILVLTPDPLHQYSVLHSPSQWSSCILKLENHHSRRLQKTFLCSYGRYLCRKLLSADLPNVCVCVLKSDLVAFSDGWSSGAGTVLSRDTGTLVCKNTGPRVTCTWIPILCQALYTWIQENCETSLTLVFPL